MASPTFSARWRVTRWPWSGVAALVVALSATPGSTQTTTYIGGGGGSGVTIDPAALDRLGPRQSHARNSLVIPLTSQIGGTGDMYSPLAAALPPLPTIPTMVAPAASTPSIVVASQPPLPPEPESPTVPAVVQPEPAMAAMVAAAVPPVPAQPLPQAEPIPQVQNLIPDEPAAAEPVPVPEPEPAAAMVATTTPPGALDLTRPVTLVTLGFAAKESALRPDAIRALDAVVAAMSADVGARIQLVAFAGGTGSSASAARRLSLSRALAVRAYLIERGVRSTRMDVRALGAKPDGGPTERVDVVALPR
ncbi:MAG: hypothetical protein EXQ94_08710 [Alphaproteobacteria bacterium]|nr:hypothetical protein [Alphaproteobacteria bacterium]